MGFVNVRLFVRENSVAVMAVVEVAEHVFMEHVVLTVNV
jgi:hypothetical protein